MFSRKKPLSLFLAFILCLQQGAFASGLDMARAADARRFAIQKTNSGEPVKLESSGFEKLEKFRKKTKSNYRIRMNGKTKNPRSLVGGCNTIPLPALACGSMSRGRCECYRGHSLTRRHHSS